MLNEIDKMRKHNTSIQKRLNELREEEKKLTHTLEANSKAIQEHDALLPELKLQPSYYMGERGTMSMYSGEYFLHSDVVKFKAKAEALLEKYLKLEAELAELKAQSLRLE
jgi:predicted  nucleic acid-binding Zn-ribbon protein